LNLLNFSHDNFCDDQHLDNDTPPLLPPEFSDWIRDDDNLTPLTDTTSPRAPIPPPIVVEHDDHIELVDPQDHGHDDSSSVPEGDHTSTAPTPPEGAPTAPEGAQMQPPFRRNPQRNVGTWKDGPAKLRSLPIDDEEYDFSFVTLPEPAVAFVARRGHAKQQSQPQRLLKSDLLDCHLLQRDWTEYGQQQHPYQHFDMTNATLVDFISDPRVTEHFVMTAKTSKYDDDNPSYDMAMRGPFQAEYYDAMRTELSTIKDDFNCWDLVPRLPGMHVLPSTWAFKIKRYPDGSVKKFKARFCARGDKQLEGIDYFETWAPVVQWSTIRIVLVLSVKLSFTSAQCDITAAFIHALLPNDEEVYIDQPRGFRTKPNHVLHLRRSLYGLKQAPRHFFHYLVERLLKQGLQQSIHDPCLFMNTNMIVIVYVDDLLIFAKTDALIDSFISSMQREEICLRKEGTAEGYLGVDISTVDGRIHLTQSGLSERIVNALGLDKYSTCCHTPTDATPLPKDTDGEPASGTINYASVVGMLLYLSGHTRPDLSFAVHQCARYTFAPTRRHEQALLRIGRYLKGTLDKGIFMNPSNNLTLDCYPDADFAGLWKHEHADDPHCVRSRTGYVITLAGCPIIWASKMQTEIALVVISSSKASITLKHGRLSYNGRQYVLFLFYRLN
jgi:hypothetical protein